MIDISEAEAPKAIAELSREAKRYGWKTRLTYAEGVAQSRGGERAVNSVCLRLQRGNEACFATWEVTNGCRFFGSVHSARGRMNVTQFKAAMRRLT